MISPAEAIRDRGCSIRLETMREITIVYAQGEIDVNNVDRLHDALAQALAQDRTRGILLSLSGTSYIDTATMYAICGLAKEAANKGCSVAVTVPPYSTARKLFGVFPLHETVAVFDKVHDAWLYMYAHLGRK